MEELDESDARILPLYLRHNLPEFLQFYDREGWSKEIDRLKLRIKAEASPGVPYCTVANRNDQLMELLGEELNDIVLDRIEKRLTLGLGVQYLSRRERIDKGLMDPVRVFVKNEPHKRAKVEEGRMRLIMSVSIVDKIVEMLVCDHLYKLEIRSWRDIPSKPGIGFSPEDNEAVYRDIHDSGLFMAESDISGWDWSVKEWMICDEARAVVKLCENPSRCWETLIAVNAILESASIYQFSDGMMVSPTFTGIVNSGKQKTSRGNSFMRVRLADLIGSRKTIAAGDDCVESFVAGAKERYNELGITCKNYTPIESSFEFCSRVYSRNGSYPVNAAKMIMNILHTTPKSVEEWRMYMIGFVDQLSCHPKYDAISGLLKAVGYFEVEGPHYNVDE